MRCRILQDSDNSHREMTNSPHCLLPSDSVASRSKKLDDLADEMFIRANINNLPNQLQRLECLGESKEFFDLSETCPPALIQGPATKKR
jgi:hypothetical protein